MTGARVRPGPAFRCFLGAWALLPGSASAHSFGRLYNLPVPFWMYVYGAAAALIASFLIVGYFVSAGSVERSQASRDLAGGSWLRLLRRLCPALRALSVAALLLCIATGLFGTRDPYRNFSMTFFWIIFLLGLAYLCALLGDLYGALNPWRALTHAVARRWPRYIRGRVAYPPALSYWPALGFYLAFIWIELFASVQPRFLGTMLLVYTVLNFGGVWLVGAAAWFRYCEFFSLFFRLIALMAPFDYAPGRLRWRAPLSGLLQERAESMSQVLFVLFMLASTAFDGLRATAPWVRLFWEDPYGLLTPWLGKPPVYFYLQLRPWFTAYESACLLLSPFLYLGVYLLFLQLVRLITGTRLGLRELALRFAYTLIPIALVYNITHYYALILTQGMRIVGLLSDPFGWGWNLLGLQGRLRAPILPDMSLVWHTQVGLILLGHIASVYLAHLEALRVFKTPRQAMLSQLPMLALMMLFTTIGLWILAQPIQSGL